MVDESGFGKLKSALGHAADCPPLPELAAALEAGEHDERRVAATEHLARCARCRDEVAVSREFLESGLRPGETQDVRWIVRRLEEQPVVPRSRRPLGWFFGLRPLLTAACVLVIAAGVVYMRRGPGAPSAFGIGEGVVRSSTIELIAPSGDVLGPPAEFQWRPVAGAARYHLRLMEVDRREIWGADAQGASAPVPPPALALMTPGKTLIWDVTAFDPSGRRLATSSPKTFRVGGQSR